MSKIVGLNGNKIVRERMNNGISVVFRPRIYAEHTQFGGGMLSLDDASHALWHYYTTVYHAWMDRVIDPIVVEGDADPRLKPFALFENIARMYQVDPQDMENRWLEVDAEIRRCNYPELPDYLKHPVRGRAETAKR